MPEGIKESKGRVKSMKKIGVGVIGAGGWGELHLETYAYDKRVELAAVCDTNKERAQKVAQKYGIGRFYTDFNQLLNDEKIKAVSIVTPDFSHTEIAIGAIRAGKDVLIEKPMATSVEDCEKIISEIKKAKVKFMVDFHNRWNPIFFKSRESIQKGQLGLPLLIYLRLNDTIAVPTEWLAWAGRSSAAWFIGSHSIDLVRWLFEDEVKKVYAVSRSNVLKKMGIDTPDFFEVILEFKKGGVGVVENCWILPKSTPSIIDFKCEIIGSEGAVYLDGSHHRAMQKYIKDEAKYPDVLVRPVIYGKPMGFAVESIRHFIDCLVSGETPQAGPEDGLAVTRIICAVNKSTQAGEPVKVN